MSEEMALSIPISTLEDLHCFICKGYLSCSPIRLISNGNYICGRCTPLNADACIHRVVALEAILSKTSFPCLFKKYGCSETLLFGKTADHEFKCVHRAFACPTNTSTACSWEGSGSQLLHHFKAIHTDLLKDKANFKLELDKDAQGVLMASENSFPFIVKYFYKATEKILKYDVRFWTNYNGFKAFFKMQLINDADADCNLNLKMNECFAYDESFYGMQNGKVLNLSKFLECLSDPDCIVVAFKLNVTICSTDNVTTANACEVNFNLIKKLKCNVCQNYLVPPLFDLDGETICCDCGQSYSNCKPASDTDILKLVNEAMYPCCWRECKFMGKSNTFKNHMMNCKFRQYSCMYTSCNTTFKLSAAADHLRTHERTGIVYMPDKITYKMSFAQHSPIQHVLTIKNNRIIVIQHQMMNSKPPYIHGVILFKSPDDLRDIIGIIDFEHEHCILKSKEFNLRTKNTLQVAFKELPSHFKETDELTVTVELIA